MKATHVNSNYSNNPTLRMTASCALIRQITCVCLLRFITIIVTTKNIKLVTKVLRAQYHWYI